MGEAYVITESMNIFYLLHETINKPLSSYLNSFTGNKIISDLVYIFADAPIFILPFFLVAYWLYYNYKKDNSGKNRLLFIFYSTVIAILVSIIIQQFVDIERPEESLKSAGKLILNHIPDASFPSDHASVGIAFLVSLFLFGFAKMGMVIFPFMVLMLISRVAGGVHWPLDILVGAIIGIFSSFIVYNCQNLSLFSNLNNAILKLSSYLKL